MLRQLYTITDALVILSLLRAPFIAQNMAFLRVLRTLRLLHSYHVLRDLRRDTPFFRRNEEVIVSSVNLGVFIFLVTALVFVSQFGKNPEIGNYVDALYFTVATLTTTGFGDITLTGNLGRLQPDIKILFTTGYSDQVLVGKEDLAAHMNILNKPYRRAELLKSVQDLLAG